MMSALLCAPLAQAGKPEVELVAAARAIYFTLMSTIDSSTVKKGGESTFLTGLLRSGPYDQLATGYWCAGAWRATMLTCPAPGSGLLYGYWR